MQVELIKYDYVDHKINLPTHYNKHSKIFNSYKYDVSQMILNFIIYKIKRNELYFKVDGESGIDFINRILKLPRSELKEQYTRLSGNLVKQNRNFYTEYLHTSIQTIEDLVNLNVKAGLDIKILKVFVDEVVVDKKLIFENVVNEFGYNFEMTKFKLFIKQLPELKKQMYITDDEIILNHSFSRDQNLITDLESILKQGIDYNNINQFTINLINHNYDISKLIQKDDSDNEFIVSDGVKVDVKYLDLNNTRYDVNYYYKIYQDIASNLVLVKNL